MIILRRKITGDMISKVFTYILPLLLIADIYIFILFIRKLTTKTLLRILWFVPTIILVVGFYFFYIARTLDDYRVVFAFTYIALSVPKIIFTAISLIDLPLRVFFKWKVYPFTIIGSCVSLFTLFAVIYGSTFGITRFEVNHVEFASSNLPASFDGYKIVQISDLHMGYWKDNKDPIEKLVKLVNEQQADAVMITGDLVHREAGELDGFEPVLSRIKAKDGVYSILGNHDYGMYKHWGSRKKERENLNDLKKRQAAMGWKLLNNEHIFLEKGNEKIALIGVENEGKPPFPQYGDLTKAMKGTDDTAFKILLSHDPYHWRKEALGKGIDLTLSGHTHGTQFAIGRISPASFVYSEWGGMYTEGSQALYVNVGIGSVMLPFRFGAWPEITVITLKRAR